MKFKLSLCEKRTEYEDLQVFWLEELVLLTKEWNGGAPGEHHAAADRFDWAGQTELLADCFHVLLPHLEGVRPTATQLLEHMSADSVVRAKQNHILKILFSAGLQVHITGYVDLFGMISNFTMM